MRVLTRSLVVLACLVTASCGEEVTTRPAGTESTGTESTGTEPPGTESASAAASRAVAAYDWVFDNGFDVATCVGVFSDVSREQVLEAFGADTSRVLDPDDDADYDLAYGQSIVATEVEGGVVTVEANGFQCSRPEVLARAADGHPAAGVFWNVESDNAFTLVRDGQEPVSVDLYDADPSYEGPSATELGLPPELLPLWDEAGRPDQEPWAAGLAMAEEVTGVAVPQDVAETPGPAYFLPG